MADKAEAKRVDCASRVIKASPQTLYRAFLNPVAIAAWRPPSGMKAQILSFDASEGGGYRMAFVFVEAGHATRGKTSEHADVFQGRFVELVPDRRIVEQVEFESDDPAFAGTMTITTTFNAVADGTEVAVRCEDVPAGVSPADHQAGMASSLENLAAFAQ